MSPTRKRERIITRPRLRNPHAQTRGSRRRADPIAQTGYANGFRTLDRAAILYNARRRGIGSFPSGLPLKVPMSLRAELILVWVIIGPLLLISSSYRRGFLIPLTALAIVLNIILWMKNSN